MTIEDLLDGGEALTGEGRPTFRARWFGYDRDQVHEELARREAQVALIRADRDSALAMAEDLARYLEGARLELGEHRTHHAGYAKGDAVSGCIRYLLHTRSRVAGEAADQRVQLPNEAGQESQRRLAETGAHACDIVGRALRESRATLDDLFERHRALEDWYSAAAHALKLPLQRQYEPQSI